MSDGNGTVLLVETYVKLSEFFVNLWCINFCCTATHHVLPRIKQTQSTQLGPAYKAIRHAYSIVPHIMVIYTDFTANAKK